MLNVHIIYSFIVYYVYTALLMYLLLLFWYYLLTDYGIVKKNLNEKGFYHTAIKTISFR